MLNPKALGWIAVEGTFCLFLSFFNSSIAMRPVPGEYWIVEPDKGLRGLEFQERMGIGYGRVIYQFLRW